jgi:hypothetical protein
MVRLWFVQLVIILSAIAVPALAKTQSVVNNDYHVIFDLDWTLINPREGAAPKPDFIESGEEYRLMPLAAESILRLHLRGFKISIFSGSPKARVETISEIIFNKVRKLAKANGHSDNNIQPYALLSAENMIPNPAGKPTDRFRNRFYKKLPLGEAADQKYFPEDRVIMVDDIPEFAAPGQEPLFLILKSTYNNFDSYSDVISARSLIPVGDETYIPPSITAWAVDRGRIPWAAEILIQAKNLSLALGIPFYIAAAQLSAGSRESAQQLGYMIHGSVMANNLSAGLCKSLLGGTFKTAK